MNASTLIVRGMLLMALVASAGLAYYLADSLGPAAISDSTVVAGFVFGGITGAFVIQLYRQVSDMSGPNSLGEAEGRVLQAGVRTLSRGLFKIALVALLTVLLGIVLKWFPQAAGKLLITVWLWLVILSPAFLLVLH